MKTPMCEALFGDFESETFAERQNILFKLSVLAFEASDSIPEAFKVVEERMAPLSWPEAYYIIEVLHQEREQLSLYNALKGNAVKTALDLGARISARDSFLADAAERFCMVDHLNYKKEERNKKEAIKEVKNLLDLRNHN